MNKILQVKPIVFFIFFFSSLYFSSERDTYSPNVLPFYLSLFFTLVSLTNTIILHLWIFVAGSSLYKFINDNNKLGISIFNFCLVVTFTNSIYGNFFDDLNSSHLEVTNRILIHNAFFLFKYLSIISYITCMKFISKTLVYVETGNNPKFLHYYKEFIAMLFLPITIFRFQPRVQSVIKDRE